MDRDRTKAEREAHRIENTRLERRSQVRALVVLALLVLLLVLLRAGPLDLFHAGWWRL